ncbi:MAG: hypothetical protein KJ941_02540 [Bacteroidetes bacterium]|nr:hypothetical protein [Bacteroidota bacterium]
MTRQILILLFLISFLKVDAQGLFDFSEKEYQFSFMMIPKQKKSVNTNYHASTFVIHSDSTFSMGLSEANETGILHKDSTLSVKLYHYNSDEANKKWAESFKIIFCNQDFLIISQRNVNYNDYFENYKGFGEIWHVYYKEESWNIRTKKLYNKLKNEHNTH